MAAEAVMKKLELKEVADLQTVPMLKLLALTRPGAIGTAPDYEVRPRRPNSS